MTPEEFAVESVRLFMEANPNDPDVLAFKQALQELHDATKKFPPT